MQQNWRIRNWWETKCWPSCSSDKTAICSWRRDFWWTQLAIYFWNSIFKQSPPMVAWINRCDQSLSIQIPLLLKLDNFWPSLSPEVQNSHVLCRRKVEEKPLQRNQGPTTHKQKLPGGKATKREQKNKVNQTLSKSTWAIEPEIVWLVTGARHFNNITSTCAKCLHSPLTLSALKSGYIVLWSNSGRQEHDP